MAGTSKTKREQDGWLERQNRALRDRGYKVSLDLNQGMVRLRATFPPKPSEPSATPWKQRRISTGLRYPEQASDAVQQAEQLGAAIEMTLRTSKSFAWSHWDRPSRGGKRLALGSSSVISGFDAVRRTEMWWGQQRKRSVSAPTTWDVDYARPLRPLLQIPELQPEHLSQLVAATELGSKSRQRCSRAAATVSRAVIG